MHPDVLTEMFQYNYWAHRQVWACVEKLSDAQFIQEFDYAWKSVHGQIVHVMGAEEVWLTRLRDGISPAILPTPQSYPTRSAIRAKWDKIEKQVTAYVTMLDDNVANEILTYRNTKGTAYQIHRGKILMHLVNHGTDHRAQILYMIHQMGAETIEQDYLHLIR